MNICLMNIKLSWISSLYLHLTFLSVQHEQCQWWFFLCRLIVLPLFYRFFQTPLLPTTCVFGSLISAIICPLFWSLTSVTIFGNTSLKTSSCFFLYFKINIRSCISSLSFLVWLDWILPNKHMCIRDSLERGRKVIRIYTRSYIILSRLGN